jgi:LPS-assembly lipoprotein
VKKIYLVLSTIILTACSGYTPLYGELGEEMNAIGLETVKMQKAEKNVGQRRLAQQMSYKLGRIFPNQFDNQYNLNVVLKKSESAIATRSDDTDKRKSITVNAVMILTDKYTNEKVFSTEISRSSTYTTQEQPFATDAAKTKALESIVSTLSGEIVQRAALWFRGYSDDENSK